MNNLLFKSNIFSLIFLIIMLGCKKTENEPISEILRPIEGDYYVSTSGNDDNPGTENQPWRTIQKAANSANQGTIVVVRSGNYSEFVTLNNGGNSEDSRIIFFSEVLEGAKIRGIKIKSDYITFDGFEIEAEGVTNWVGIYIDGTSYVDIINCYVHDCPTGGINITNGADNVQIVENRIEHNGQWGINLVGFYCLIEKNYISTTVQYHPKGDEPGFSGNDADGMRIFGNNHVVKSNTFYNIGDPNDSANEDPHVDCIQAWDGYSSIKPIVTNTIIESNYFMVKHPSGKGIIVDATYGNACSDIMIRNNIFEFQDIGIGMYDGDFRNISVLNNVFKAKIGSSSWGTSVKFVNISNLKYLNNITVDCHPQHRYIQGGTGSIDYNLAWNSDGSTPSLEPASQANELIKINPAFVSYTGEYGENDYHIQSSSPAINKGLTLIEVQYDFDGISRPQGSAYDIGAFEYK
ncbi:MAG: right-handed parallel beta-helix repeat-containing protein [Bacteroidales bacterium]|nr:right-handed parallel beta-helix repeat-containing protein [Bacteroidales bacterium]MBN2755526.1 right-handed parallel beta-helix repeat-containing protein [Bacteroidales bacterium]